MKNILLLNKYWQTGLFSVAEIEYMPSKVNFEKKEL